MAIRHPSPHRQRVPTLWLMTDERMGERLWDAIAQLPRGSGVVFRHFATPPEERALLLQRVRQIARKRRLALVTHGGPNSIRIRPAHSIREAIAAWRARADLIFVSPIYPTRTHPGGRALGPLCAARIARSVPIPAIALGGMTSARFKRLEPLGFTGWAAIDGLTPHQKRKAVPI